MPRTPADARPVSSHEPPEGEPDVSSRGSARRRCGQLHPVHQGAGRRRGDRPGRRERPGAAHRVRGGAAAESDPGQWWEALGEALRQCGGRGARGRRGVASAGSSTAWSRWTQPGEPVRPALLWNDVRSAPQARRLTEELGGAKAWAERAGSVPGRLLHGRQVGLAARARAGRGRAPPPPYGCPTTTSPSGSPARARTDRGDASGHRLVGVRRPRRTTTESSAMSGSTPALLPACGAARRGRPGPCAAADDLPLPEGTLVAAGTGDNVAAALGLGPAARARRC